MKKVKLDKKYIDYLSKVPEQGMGYQNVDIVLKNGNILTNMKVLNSKYLILNNNENFVSDDIETIKIKEEIINYNDLLKEESILYENINQIEISELKLIKKIKKAWLPIPDEMGEVKKSEYPFFEFLGIVKNIWVYHSTMRANDIIKKGFKRGTTISNSGEVNDNTENPDFIHGYIENMHLFFGGKSGVAIKVKRAFIVYNNFDGARQVLVNPKDILEIKKVENFNNLLKLKEETINYNDLLKENKNINKYSIPEIEWLFFLCFLYQGKMEKKSWDKDNRVGVNFKDTMLKFLNNGIIKDDDKYYYCDKKGKEIVLFTFYRKDFKEVLYSKHEFEQYDIGGRDGYHISRTPYYLWEILNPKIKEEFDKLKDLHIEYWNSNPEGMGEPKYLDQMLKSPHLDLYNYKNLFDYFYPNKVPNIITLYRGIKQEYDIKFQEREFSSWTLNKKQAERFSKYHFVSLAISGPQESEKQTILKTEIPIKDIDIVIGGNEAEVILKNPVKNVDVETIKEETILYEDINNKDNITKISIFDFDGTLIETELPESGKKIWEEKTGKDWPYRGWWGKIESLSSIFDNNVNSQAYEGYKKSIKEPNNLTILMTGRLKNIFENRVKELLKEKGLNKFDEYYFNTGWKTFDTKIQQIESLLKKYPQVTKIEMWEDRPKHIEGFKEWFKTKNNIELKVNFIDTGHYEINEEDNNIIKEENKIDIKKDLEKLVWQFRIEQEKYYDWKEDKICFKGTCQDITEKLVEFLNKNGYNNVKRIGGYYKNVSDDFESNTENWDNDDYEDYENFKYKFPNTWKHWWVEVNNKYIVDITSDQFHPGEEDEYRVIITDINDPDYTSKILKEQIINYNDLLNEQQLLLEGRIEDIRKKYRNTLGFNESIFQEIIKRDPSGNQKYLDWIMKQWLNVEDVGMNLEIMIELVGYFHKNTHKYKKKDINQYKTSKELEQATEEAKQKLTKGEIERMAKQETNVLLNDNDYFVVIPKSHRASCYYGAGTRWCTTEKDPMQFESTSKQGHFLYVIDKHKKPFIPKEKTTGSVGPGKGDIKYKVAILIYKDSDKINIWYANDDKINDVKDYFQHNPKIGQILSQNNLLTFKQKIKYDLMSKKELDQIYKEQAKLPSLAGRLIKYVKLRQTKGEIIAKQIFSEEEIALFNGRVEFNDNGIILNVESDVWEKYYSGLDENDIFYYNSIYSNEGFRDEFDEDELNYVYGYLNNTAIEQVKYLMKLHGKENLIEQIKEENTIADFIESLPEGKDKLYPVLWTINDAAQEHLQGEMKEAYEGEANFESNFSYGNMEIILPYDKLISVLLDKKDIKSLADLENAELNGEISLGDDYSNLRGQVYDSGGKNISEKMIDVVNHYIEILEEKPEYTENYNKFQQILKDLKFDKIQNIWILINKKRYLKFSLGEPDYLEGKITVLKTILDKKYQGISTTEHKIPIDSLGSFVTVGTLFENKSKIINYNDLLNENNNINEFMIGRAIKSLPELNEMEFVNKITKKLNLPQISIKDKLGSGEFGNAYIVGDKVLKITSQKREAVIANKLIGKNLKYVANYYDVFKLQSKEISNVDLWVILLEKLDKRNIKISDFIKMENMLEGEIGLYSDNNDAIQELEKYAKKYNENKEIIEEIREHILAEHSKDKNMLKFFDFIINVHTELIQYGIDWFDLHLGNIGTRNGELVGFDIASDVGGQIIKKRLKLKEENVINYNVLIPDDWKSQFQIEGNNIVLYHYGPQELKDDYLDPKYFGQKSYTSDVKQWGQKRLFFYIKPEDREWRVTGKEYIVKYPLNKLYPFNKDPLDFYEKCQKEYNMKDLPINIQVMCVGNKAKENGFSGMINKWENSFRVDIWEKVYINNQNINENKTINYNDLLKEGKQRGILYHFTNVNNLEQILKENKLKDYVGYGGISLTRNYNLGYRDARISLNGDKITQKYKISPLLSPEDIYSYRERLKMYKPEAEEKVLTRNIDNIKDYIVQIDILEHLPIEKQTIANVKKFNKIKPLNPIEFKSFEETKEQIKQIISNNSDIKINLVNNFLPVKDVLLKEQYNQSEMVSVIVKINNNKGIAIGEIFNKDKSSLIIVDRYYSTLNSYDVEVGQLSGKEQIIELIYDNGELFDNSTKGVQIAESKTNKENFNDLFNQIKNKKYQDISLEMWDDLQYEGWLDELEDMFKIEINGSEQLEYILLDISKEDYKGLISFDDNIVTKYTNFDMELKNSGLYDKGYLDFIDYDKGIIYIIRIKRNLIKENINLLKEEEQQLNFFEVGDYTVGSDWIKEEFLNRIAKKLNVKIKKYINSGVFGNAYEIEGNKVLKITTDKEEAEAVNRLVNKNLKYVVKYYYVGKIQSSKLTLENHDLYAILMEKVNDASKKFSQDMLTITNKLGDNIGGMIAEKIMWGEFKLIDDKLFIWHDEIDLNIFDKNGKELFDFMFNLHNELKKYGLLYSDLHNKNVGIKNGKFIAFDITSEQGGLGVKKKLTLKEENNDIIQENNNSLCFQYPSDEIRYNLIKDELKNPDEIWDDEEFYNENDLQETKWLTKVLNKKDYLDYYELFVDDCWVNLFNKPEYKSLSKEEAIKKLVNKRFVKIGNLLNLKIKDWSFENDILNIKFYKQNKILKEEEKDKEYWEKYFIIKGKIMVEIDKLLNNLVEKKDPEYPKLIFWVDKNNGKFYMIYNQLDNILNVLDQYWETHITKYSISNNILIDMFKFIMEEFLDITIDKINPFMADLHTWDLENDDLIKEDLGTFGSNLVPSTGNDNPVEFSHKMLNKTNSFKYDNDNTINYNRINEFSHGILNARIGDIPGNIPLKIAKKLGYKQAEFINSGNFGNVYDIGLPDKLMKVTMDEDEAETSFKLIGKNLENVVNFYNVYKLDLSKYKEEQPSLKREDLFVIIMDKVDFNKKENYLLDNNLDNAIVDYYHKSLHSSKFQDIRDLISKLTDNPYLKDNGLEEYIKQKETDIYEYYIFIVSLTGELNKYGIKYGDIQPGNFGRKNGKLVSFDMGMSEGGKKIEPELKIDEKVFA